MAAIVLEGSARERLLVAASELFYAEGVNVVGIDRIIERAGVAKASLYSTYGSKEELVRAYLEDRLRARQLATERGLAKFDTPRERLLGFFDVLGELFASPRYRGCAFINACVESKPDSAAVAVGKLSREWVHSLVLGLASEVGVADPVSLAKQLVLLHDGSLMAAMMDRDKLCASTAKAAAEELLDAALAR